MDAFRLVFDVLAAATISAVSVGETEAEESRSKREEREVETGRTKPSLPSTSPSSFPPFNDGIVERSRLYEPEMNSIAKSSVSRRFDDDLKTLLLSLSFLSTVSEEARWDDVFSSFAVTVFEKASSSKYTLPFPFEEAAEGGEPPFTAVASPFGFGEVGENRSGLASEECGTRTDREKDTIWG